MIALHLFSTIVKQVVIFVLGDYMAKTLEPVMDEIQRDPSIDNWRRWISKWSKFSIEDFLRTTKHQDKNGPRLRPWPEAAIEAFKVYTF